MANIIIKMARTSERGTKGAGNEGETGGSNGEKVSSSQPARESGERCERVAATVA